MSAVITAKGKAPHRVRLLATNSTGETANVDQATILAACADGPLKSYLADIPPSGGGEQRWSDIGDGKDPKVSYNTEVVNGAITAPVAWTALGTNSVDITTSGAGAVLLEIVFNHRAGR